jgi:hypothetical protein
MVALILALSLLVSSSRNTDGVTPENVQDHIRVWMDRYHASVRTLPQAPGVYFGIEANLGNGHIVNISRPIERDRVLTLFMKLVNSNRDPGEKMYTSLSDDHKERIRLKLTLEMARMGIEYRMTEAPLTLTLLRTVSITPQITENDFVNEVARMRSAAVALQSVFTLEVIELKMTEQTQ